MRQVLCSSFGSFVLWPTNWIPAETSVINGICLTNEADEKSLCSSDSLLFAVVQLLHKILVAEYIWMDEWVYEMGFNPINIKNFMIAIYDAVSNFKIHVLRTCQALI